MKNFIGLNINYLCDTHKMKKTEFGELFDLKQTTVHTYTSGRSNPPIDVIQKICEHFDITLDAFINVDMMKEKYSTPPKITSKIEEPTARYSDDKQMVIDAQKETITTLREHISLLKDKVEMLETKAARAS